MIKLHWTSGDGGAYGRVTRNMRRETNHYPLEEADVVIHHGHPVRLNQYKNKKKVWIAAENHNEIEIERLGAILLVPDYTIAVSEFCKKTLLQYIDKVGFVHNGVDTDLYKPMWDFRGINFRFFTTSTEECYGKTYMEEAWIMAAQKMDRVELLLKDHRQGGLTKGERKHIKENLPCSIISEPSGWKLTQNELVKLYNTADCLFYPVPSTAFGLILLESMACGVSPIVPNYGAMPEIVDEKVGYFCPVEIVNVDLPGHYLKQPQQAHMKIKDLKDTLIYAYNNRDEVREKGKLARKKVLEKFTWKHSADKLMKLLEENI